EIAVHRINAFHNHELAAPFLTAQRGIKRGCVVMLEFLGAASGQDRAISQTEGGASVEDRRRRRLNSTLFPHTPLFRSLTAQRGIKRGCVVMLEFLGAASGQDRAISQTEVGAIV